MKKLIALLLATVMSLSLAVCAQAAQPTGYTEAPFITALGTYGAVEDRLPVAGDIMVEDADYLTIGVYGGELKRSAGGGNWDAGMKQLV